MDNCFSKELIKKAQAYFERKWEREMSLEETNNYLHSLADLYLSFVDADIVGGEVGFHPPLWGGENQPNTPVILD